MIGELISLDRARNLRNRGRAKSWGPEPVIAYWKCRTFSCITRVGVTETAFEVLAIVNAELAKRREKQLEENEVMYCVECAARRKERARW